MHEPSEHASFLIQQRTDVQARVEQAQDDGIAYAENINGITRDGEKCSDYASCKTILDAGGDVDL